MRFPKFSLRSARRNDTGNPTPPATPPKLILHAGSQKTGTTGIQFAMSENRTYLESVRVWYPRINEFFPVNPKLSRARAHFAFANAVMDYRPRDRKRLSHILDTMQARAGEFDRVILSAETMFRLTADASDAAEDEVQTDKRLRFLERLARLTRPFEPEILLYLRRVDRFAASLYAESMVQKDTTKTFRQFLSAKGDRFNYRSQIDQFNMFFPVQVQNFEATAKSGLIETFCTHAGIPGPLPPTVERPRPSVSNAAVLWLRRAKQERPDMPQLERNHRWHFALLPENAERFERDKKTEFWRSKAERDAFIEKNQAGVTEVDFPEVEDSIAPLVTWSDDQHAEAEQTFFAWRSANQAMLKERKRKKLPPFALDA